MRSTRLVAVLAAVAVMVSGAVVGGTQGMAAAATGERADISSEAVSAVEEAGIAKSADLSKFQPGHIISDAVFFNKGTMTEAQIQTFLEQRVPRCDAGYTCLKDWYDTSRTTSADAMCGAYSGGVRERASRIIYKVAQACGINPQVILVTLQKEQGLVTHNWPSDWRYTIAMGQGCPDTAACDTRYYGFFNQVYGAAWQMKRYANPPGTSQFFTWYAPGKTWNILYNPNRSCGTSPVYVQNQATANLYYYTPYQPNAAAIRAGYAEGDGCSSYGNRNFFNYFTDWFGSTQGVNSAMIKVGADVFLVSGANRYPIGPSLLSEYQSVFGRPVAVSADYAASFALKPKATAFIRDASNGRVALLQGSRSHHFGSCALVAAFGGLCNTEVALTSADYNRVPAGDRMTWHARTIAGGAIHAIDGDTLRPYIDAASAAMANGGSEPYAAVLAQDVAARYTVGPTLFAPANFITVAGSSRVLLPTSDQRLLYLPSWSVAQELGLPSSAYRRSVDSSAVASFADGGRLELFARCDGQTYFGSQGTLRLVAASAADGFTVAELDATTCGKLKRSGTTGLAKVFVRATGGSAVYMAEGGVYRHVTSPTALRQLGGGVEPTVLSLSGASVDRLPKGEPVRVAPTMNLPVGEFFTATGSPRVYLPLTNGEALYLPAWSVAAELGLPGSPSRSVDAATISAIRQVGTLSQWVTCDGVLYFAAQGELYPVQATAAAGFATATLDSATCGKLRRTTSQPLASVFVRPVGGSAVYLAENGVLRHVTSPSRLVALGGGTMPTVLPVSPVTIDRYGKGPSITATSG